MRMRMRIWEKMVARANRSEGWQYQNNEVFTKDSHLLGLVLVVMKRQRVCGTKETLAIRGGR